MDDHGNAGTPQHYGHGGSNISTSSGAGAVPPSSSADESAGENMDAGLCSEQMMEPFNNNNIAVFLDRTFKMIETVSDDIVCWSEAGDSFIIKQVQVFEGLLPSYYNHKNYLSFVRQLNFYGFKKVKGPGSHSKSTSGGAAAAAGAGAGGESDPWREFMHPQFRRGRRDLLVGIKRHKDSGRVKRKRAESQQSDILNTLQTDVSRLCDEMKTMNSMVDGIMTLLTGTARGHGQPRQCDGAAPNNLVLQPHNSTNNVVGVGAGVVFNSGGNGGGGSGSSSGTQVSYTTVAAQAPNARGGAGGVGDSSGLMQWGVGAGIGGGGNVQGGQDACLYGAPLGTYVAPLHQQQQQQQQPPWQGHPLYLQQHQQAATTEQYLLGTNQIRFQMGQPNQ